MKPTIEDKSKRLFKEGKVKLISNFRSVIFEVKGDTETYTVIFNKKGGGCTCKWSSFRQGLCSHQQAVMLYCKENNINLSCSNDLK